MKLRFLFFTSLLLTCSFSNAQLLQWNTFGNVGTETTEPSVFNNANIAAANLTMGAGVTPAGNTNRFGGSAWFDTGDTNPTTLAESVAGNDYIQFVVTPNAGYSFTPTSFVFNWDRSGTGPGNVTLRSSVDGFSSDIGTISPAASIGIQNTITISGLSNITSATTFRLYGYGAIATGGTGGFDIGSNVVNVTLNGLTTPTTSLDFNNLQFPGSATINVGSNFTAYAKAYEPGVTEAAGPNAAVQVWIGYSSANTNPSSAGWTWIPATYNVQVGNDDEYQLTFGAALPEGIYYYASRFSLSSSGYTYGGYSTSNGGNWNGSTNISGVLVVNGPNTLDYVNLQTPATGSFVIGGAFNVFAQCYEPTITTIPSHQGGGISSWIGYSTSNSNPSGAGWTWVAANFNGLNGDPNNDEYMLNLGAEITTAGTYYYASRFQLDSGAYRYGGILANGNPGGFWDGTTYISGVLTATAAGVQEINVKGVTGSNPTINSGDTTPSGTDNTLFAAQTIGTPQTKIFRIQNIGGAPLSVTSLSLIGGNVSDFSISAAAPYTIPPVGTNFVDFTITFTPTALGVRTTTVHIANNDSNENPYTFIIQGSGNCSTATNTLTPSSGPVGTEITVTATANNLTGATATFNGIAATVTQISATQIKVIVPAGAMSGNLITTNSQGCTATTSFNVIDETVSACQGGGALPLDLFITQLTDSGADGYSYIEIFNGTGNPVNLSTYSIQVFNNGSSTPTNTVALNSFNLMNNSTYILAIGTGSPACTGFPGGAGELAHQTSGIGGVNFKNGTDNTTGHDHIRLYKNAVHVDSWGVYGSQNWAIPLNLNGEGANFIRSGTTVPSTTYSNAEWIVTDWGEACSDLDYSDIGTYDFSTGTPPTITLQPAYSPSCGSTALTVAGTEGFAGGNPLAYQWYVVAPGFSSWTAITNSGVYSGATTATLNISSIAGLEGYQYYSQVRENGTSCYTASNATTLHEMQSVWSGTAWSPAAPTSASAVMINGNYNTLANGNIDACSLTVNSGSTLTIASNTYVSIQNNLTVNSTGTLDVLDEGSLVMISNAGLVTNNGTMKVSRTTTPFKKFDYTYWSSPVNVANIGTTFPGWRTDYSFTFATANFSDTTGPNGTGPADGFDDNNNAWTAAPAAVNMVPAKGYAIMAPTTGTFPQTSTVTFNGRINNGIYTLPMALSANGTNVNDDFNLIGNPYPSAIDGNAFINANPSISGTLYFWTHVTAISTSAPGPDAANFITADYAMYNLSGGTQSGTNSTIPTGKIASAQGFFVEAQSATNVVFNNAMRNKNHNNSDFFRAATTTPIAQRDRFWLSLQNPQGLFSQQLVGYFPEATIGVDQGYDGIINPTENTVSFYSLIDGLNYRIQGRSAFDPTDVVPLGYKSSIAGNFTIAVDLAEGLFSSSSAHIYLVDLALGTSHDLLASPYVFSTSAGTFNNRFELRYVDQSLAVPDADVNASVVVASSDHRLRIKSDMHNIINVDVYDILGRLISAEKNIDDAEYTGPAIDVERQVFIVRITLANGTRIDRKIIL